MIWPKNITLKMKVNFFLKYVKLYIFIPEKWEGNNPSFHFQRTPSNYLEIVKQNCHDKWQSTKKVYLYYSIGGIFPVKHQRRRANDLSLDFDSIKWPIIYGE